MLLERKNENYLDQLFNNFIYSNKSLLLKTNIKEEENKYILEILVPSIKKEDINIKLDDEYLTVSIKAKEDNDKYLLKEFSFSNISRTYYIGRVENEDIKAKLNDGVLLLTIEKNNYKDLEAKNIIIE